MVKQLKYNKWSVRYSIKILHCNNRYQCHVPRNKRSEGILDQFNAYFKLQGFHLRIYIIFNIFIWHNISQTREYKTIRISTIFYDIEIMALKFVQMMAYFEMKAFPLTSSNSIECEVFGGDSSKHIFALLFHQFELESYALIGA